MTVASTASHAIAPGRGGEDFQAATAELLRTRVQLTAALFVLLLGLGDLAEWTGYPERRAVLARFYPAEVIVCVLAVLAVRLGATCAWRRLVAIATVSALVTSGNWYNAVVGCQAERQAIIQVSILTSVSVLLPLGWSAQAVYAVISVGTFVLAAPFATFSDRPVYPVMALTAGGVASVLSAFFNDRYRRAGTAASGSGCTSCSALCGCWAGR